MSDSNEMFDKVSSISEMYLDTIRSISMLIESEPTSTLRKSITRELDILLGKLEATK